MTMELELDLGQEFAQSQTLKVSPRLVAANYILELSSQELQQAIAAELNENPALELVDVPTCRVCGTEMHGSICPRCIQRQKSGSSYGPDGRSYPFDDVPESRDRSPPDEDMPIAEYLVGSLDEKGYLRIRPEDVAYELSVSEDRVRAVLRVLQAQE